jgi:hypothetical protein
MSVTFFKDKTDRYIFSITIKLINMKILIIHDDTGKIRGSVIPSAELPNAGVKLVSGLRVHTIHADDMEDDKRHEYLLDIHLNHFVDMIAKEPALIRKKNKKSQNK